ncbi:hypothetical protein H3Z83_04820 [Tenacibaculum sp. S7007]|uniref:Uncharacterized protein n=1 Tax=Tenacibaculum pelagium TaxID=2759527 RepID=A0A839AMY7_9FLAO|nr:hypothetical protein [Tenacibaculum pelagium]MBA6155846.1 hypothetical protein [Tenacibaculum pelagium]
MYSEEEVEKQDKIIEKKLWVVLMPILIITVIALSYKTDSLKYKKRIYFQAKEVSYSGIIISKKIDKLFGEPTHRTPRIITLNSNYERSVLPSIYDRLKIGDSIIKNKGSDSVYYYRNKRVILIDDELKYLRESSLVKK